MKVVGKELLGVDLSQEELDVIPCVLESLVKDSGREIFWKEEFKSVFSLWEERGWIVLCYDKGVVKYTGKFFMSIAALWLSTKEDYRVLRSADEIEFREIDSTETLLCLSTALGNGFAGVPATCYYATSELCTDIRVQEEERLSGDIDRRFTHICFVKER